MLEKLEHYVYIKGSRRYRFREFEVFIFALLKKQSWRLTTNISSSVAKVLQAKYFHNASFLTAKSQLVPSCIWRSIVEARALLIKA